VATQTPKSQPNEKHRPKQRAWVHRAVTGVILTAVVVFVAATLLILMKQGITQGTTILNIIYIIVGVVISLLVLLLTYFQWIHSRPINASEQPPPSSQSQPANIDVHTSASEILPQTPFPQTVTSDPTESAQTDSSRMSVDPDKKAIDGDSAKLSSTYVHQEDWGVVPHIENFYGREQECLDLKSWILDKHCRVIAVSGIGGIGKTSIAATVARQIKDEFDFVLWRSLQNAPPLEVVLRRSILFFSNQQVIDLPEDIENQILLLIDCLQQHRCLLVLDNVETILQGGDRAGQWRSGYEGYGRLIQLVGEVYHQSCLLLTSREKPNEIARLEGSNSSITSLQISGLGKEEAQQILKDKGLVGTERAWAALIDLYSGNPLALMLVSESIREIFAGDISAFLAQEQTVVGSIYDLLSQQITRLSELEHEILFWLAIDREAVTLDVLQEDLAWAVQKKVLLSALQSLRRRSMIENRSGSRFSLQPVIMEYVIDDFVQHVCEEINSEALKLFATHALLKAQSKDYVRNTQIRLIVKPVVNRLLTTYDTSGSEQKLKNVLSVMRKTPSQTQGYAAGNVLNLLIHLNIDLKNYDFSHLTVWQAYLQGAVLPGVNFSHADLTSSVFTETFGSILSAAFNPDGNIIAGGTSGGEVRLWDTEHIRPFLTFQGHKGWVWTVAFSPDGHLVASGSEDQTVRLWEVSTGQELKLLRSHSGWVRAVTFSPDGRLLASGGEDKKVRLWEVSTGALLNMFSEYPGWIRTIAFSPDGNLLATGGEDQAVWLWEVSTGKCLNVLQSHLVKVRSLAFSPDGRMLVCGGLVANKEESSLCFWDLSAPSELLHLREHNKSIWSVAFSPDSKFIAAASDNDHSVRIWEVSTGDCLHTLVGHRSSIRTVAFSPDGQLLVSGSEDQTLRIWDTATGECHKNLQGFSTFAWSTAFSPDRKTIASGDEDHLLRLWEVRSGRVLRTLYGHTFRITSVAFSLDGKMIASGSEDNTVRVWDARSGSCLAILRGHTHKVRSVAFSEDSSLLASGGEDRTVRLWDIRSSREVKCLEGHTNLIWTVAFSSTENIVASGSADQTARLWNTQTGQELKILRGHTGSVWSLAFSSDGAMIASGSADQTVRLWNIPDGEYLKTLQGHTQRVKAVAFSPDGTTIVSGSEDLTARLWDIESGNCLKSFQCSTDQIRSIAFSSDVRLLACSTTEGAIHLLDIMTGKQLKTFKSDRPYEHMNITGAKGLTEVQKITLKTLGAFEDYEFSRQTLASR